MVRENIAKYIRDNGIKQSFVASSTGMTPQAISSMVNGERELDVEEYIKICNLFGVSYDFFVNGTATV